MTGLSLPPLPLLLRCIGDVGTSRTRTVLVGLIIETEGFGGVRYGKNLLTLQERIILREERERRGPETKERLRKESEVGASFSSSLFLSFLRWCQDRLLFPLCSCFTLSVLLCLSVVCSETSEEFPFETSSMTKSLSSCSLCSWYPPLAFDRIDGYRND